MKRRKATNGRAPEQDILYMAGERAIFDSLHQYFLDMADHHLKDPNVREFVDEFMEKLLLHLLKKTQARRRRV